MSDTSRTQCMDPTVKRNREWFGMCDHFIELEDPWAGTYCKLRKGHEGDHEAHYAASSRTQHGTED